MKRKKFGRYLLLFAVMAAALAWTACAEMGFSSLLHTHAYGDWETVQAATCTEDGVEVRTCACGEKETRALAAKGHTEWILPSKPATCTETGLTEGRFCSVCGEAIQKQEVIPMTSHTLLDVVTPPTSTQDGYTTHTCSVCGYSYRDSSVPATGSIGLTYTIHADGKSCTVTGIGSCTDKDIVIPKVNPAGYPVTAIGHGAFQKFTHLISITIPDSVTSIGNYAFYDCTGLTSITIPCDVTSIGYSAFYGCRGLTSITIPSGVTRISDYAFAGCTGLTSLTIPGSVTSIGGYAFSRCTGLTSLTIPGSVTNIGDSAFADCTGLTFVIIPGSVTNIGDFAFYGCTGLTSISFLGTVGQWNAIKKGRFWYSNVGDFTIHCTDGNISK